MNKSSNEIPKSLIDAIKQDKLILFVGAGMSVNLGFPNWSELIKKILEILENSQPNDEKRYLIKSLSEGFNNRLDIFETLKKLEDNKFEEEVKRILPKIIEEITYDENKLKNHEKLWSICQKIVTTNYDRLLDDVKPKKIVSFTNINKDQLGRITTESKPFLYHIHGIIDDKDSCILFHSEYERLYLNDNPNSDKVRDFIKNNTILFLGFSLSDPFINKQFEYLQKLYDGHLQKEHFVIAKKEEDFSKYQIKTHVIENWNDAFDNFLDKLIEEKSKVSQSENIPQLLPSSTSANEVKSFIECLSNKYSNLTFEKYIDLDIEIDLLNKLFVLPNIQTIEEEKSTQNTFKFKTYQVDDKKDSPEPYQIQQTENIRANTEVEKKAYTFDECFEEFDRIIILGSPGSGKTQLTYRKIKELCVKYNEDTDTQIPIFIKLNEYKFDGNDNCEVDKILNFYFKDIYGVSGLWEKVKERKIIFMFDGLDEISNEHRKKWFKVFNRIYSYSKEYKLVITSREGIKLHSLESNPKKSSITIKINNFDILQKNTFINNWCEVFNKDYDIIRKNKLNRTVESLNFADNAFWLTSVCYIEYKDLLKDDINTKSKIFQKCLSYFFARDDNRESHLEYITCKRILMLIANEIKEKEGIEIKEIALCIIDFIKYCETLPMYRNSIEEFEKHRKDAILYIRNIQFHTNLFYEEPNDDDSDRDLFKFSFKIKEELQGLWYANEDLRRFKR